MDDLTLASKPDHVSLDLVRDLDPWVEIMAAGADGHARAARFHTEYPPIFWATRLGYFGGCWVPRRAEDLRRILQDPETFTSQGLTGFSQLIGEAWPLIPLEVDPPQHSLYRILLNPLFTPKKVAELGAEMQALASDLILAVVDKGGCDFNAAFATRFPVLIFLKLMGWPLDEAPKFVAWTRTLVKSSDMALVAGVCGEIAGYLRGRIAERRLNPTDDFTSYVLGCEIEGRKLTEDEVLGVCFLIFIGGLDTVTSALGFQFHHLARHPEHQAQLREKPELILAAVEELLRAYSIVNMRRMVTKDVRVGDVLMRKGDHVLISTELADLDPEEFTDPTQVDFERQDNRHMAFSYGPHRCLGSHLARRELAIALQEWLTRVPPFRLRDEQRIEMRASGVFSLENLELQWT
ncbi:MAG TPA: cytochrome P450 [Caulobacteraceae bacterium]